MKTKTIARQAFLAVSFLITSNFLNNSFAQNIGINATGISPAASAGLDVDFTNKGVLIPRVALTATNAVGPIAAPAVSLLVYNTATAGTAPNNVIPGYYYWEAGQWKKLSSDGEGWKITGNSNIGVANFLGTTNNVAIDFRTNNLIRSFITADGRSAAGLSAYTTTQFSVDAVSPNIAGIVGNTNFAGSAIQGQTTNANADAIVGVFGGGAGAGSAGFFTSTVATSSSPTVFVQNAGAGRTLSIASNGTTNNTNALFVSQLGTGINSSSVWGQTNGISGGVFLASSLSNNSIGLNGQYIGGGNYDAIGVLGLANSNAGYGIGVLGQGNWYGVFSNGNLAASGTKTFIIDHPLDPENKFLKHFSIESPEVLNLYRGTIQLDQNGEAEITLPTYFDAININFSYQLTAIGASMPNLSISEEMENGKFKVSGGVSAKKVAWIVYAERNDEYMKQTPNSREVEVNKKSHEKGKYLMPALYGQPKEKGIFNHEKELLPADDKNVEIKNIDVDKSLLK